MSLGASRPCRRAVAASVTRDRMRAPVPDALAPSVDHLADDGFDLRDCDAGRSTSSPICHWGDPDASRRAVVIGDSHGKMWMPGFVAFARRQHVDLVPLIRFGCVPSLLWRGGVCSDWYAWTLGQVRRLHPSVVVLSQFWSSWGPGSVAAVSREIADLTSLTSRVIVIEDAPGRTQPAVDCLLASHATLGSCTFSITDRQRQTYRSMRNAARGRRALRADAAMALLAEPLPDGDRHDHHLPRHHPHHCDVRPTTCEAACGGDRSGGGLNPGQVRPTGVPIVEREDPGCPPCTAMELRRLSEIAGVSEATLSVTPACWNDPREVPFGSVIRYGCSTVRLCLMVACDPRNPA